MLKQRVTKEQKIALFALITLVALYFTINYLKGKDLFSGRGTYYTIYQDVSGLAPTSPIYLKGLKVGTIERISYNQQEDNFLLTMKIKSQYKIPINSIATSFSADLLGTRAINIEMGSSPIYIQNRDTVASSFEIGMLEMLSKEFLPLKEQISALVASLDSTISGINSILDESAQKSIEESISNLNNTLANISNFSQDLNSYSPQITAILENSRELTAQLNSGAEWLNSGLENVSTITDSIKNANLSGTINSLHSLLEKLQTPTGSIGKLMTTDSLYNSVQELLQELEQLIDNINSNPKKYIKISLF